MYCRLKDIKEHLPRTGRVINYGEMPNKPQMLEEITSRLIKTGFRFLVAVQQL